MELTLPLMLEEFDRVVVVDWSCPEKSGEFAECLGASVVYNPGQKYFSMAKARNLGARQVVTEKVCFVDADVMCMPGLGDELRALMSQDAMVISARSAYGHDVENLFGFLGCSLTAFWAVGGYDESYKGWGHEDSHLRGKLFLDSYLKPKRLSGMVLGGIAHSNTLRAVNHELPIQKSSDINFAKLNAYFQARGIRDWMSDERTRDITFIKRNHNDSKIDSQSA